MRRHFNCSKKLSKYKYLEIETWKSSSIGAVLVFNIGGDHPGARLSLSLWWTLDIVFYDIRHREEIDKDLASQAKQAQYKDMK